MGRPESLSEDGIRAALSDDHREWLEHLDVFATIDSTNDWLVAQTPPAAGRLAAAVADYQSKGRGRRGRQWDIPAGYGLCLSVGRLLAVPPERIAPLTLACGVAVAEALERFGVDSVGLKWPNDLVLDDGKLGGILSEIASHSRRGLHVVVGVGINVALPEGFAPPGDIGWGRGPAALAEALDPLPARDAIAAGLIDALQRAFDAYEAEGFAPFATRWSDRDWLRGTMVRLTEGQKDVRGLAVGIDEDGALMLDTDGGRRHVVAGDILGVRRTTEDDGT